MRRPLVVLGAALMVVVADSPAQAQEGVLLVVNKSESTLSFVHAPSRTEVAEVETGFAPHEVALSPDGRWAYVSDYGTGPEPGNTVTIVDVAARSTVGTIDLGAHTRPHGITVAGDGSVWVTTEGTAHLLKLDPETRTVVLEAETGQQVTHMVVVTSPLGRAFTANIGSGTVTAVDAETGEVLAHLRTGAGAEGLALSPDGQRVYVANRSAGTLSEIDVASSTVTRSLEVGDFPIRVEVMPDGSRALVSNAQANELAVVDLAQWTVERRIPVGAVPVGIQITPDGLQAYVANTQADKVSVVDLQRWEVVGEIVAGAEPDGMAWVGEAR
jgi:YVTN family beta-propeller protein